MNKSTIRRRNAASTHEPEAYSGNSSELFFASVFSGKPQRLRASCQGAWGGEGSEGFCALGSVCGDGVLPNGRGQLASRDLRGPGHCDGQAYPSRPSRSAGRSKRRENSKSSCRPSLTTPTSRNHPYSSPATTETSNTSHVPDTHPIPCPFSCGAGRPMMRPA